MSTQSTAYPNPTCDACECQANPGCGGEVCPVNFADGSTELNRSFMRTEGVGNFKLTYYNGWKVDGAAADYQGPVGYNWTIDAFPYVTTGGSGEIIFTWAPGRRGKSVWFNQSGTSYTALFGARQTCTEDGDFWRVTDPDGTVWVFSMEDELLKTQISPSGLETHCEIVDGRIVEKWREIDGEVEARKFEYTDDLLTAVILYRGTSLDHFATPIRRTVFGYYTTDLAEKGSTGDLKTVSEEAFDGSSWQSLGTNYYRYWVSNSNVGFIHGLRYAVGPTAYNSLGPDPDSICNHTVAGVASNYYEYWDDGSRRVKTAGTFGQSIVFHLAYYEAPHAVDGYDEWQLKTVATLPDSSTKTVFSNSAGRDLLIDHSSSSGRWIHYNKYDEDGHLIWRVEPSAINMAGPPYDDDFPDLDVKIHSDKGLIHVTTYYSSTGGGAAKGYPEFQRVQHGASGDPINISKTEYTSHSTGTGPTLSVIFPVSKQTVYRHAAGGGSEAIDTEFDYDNSWFSGTNQPERIITKLPLIETSQNGEPAPTIKTQLQKFDTLGRLISSTDPRGTETTYTYNDITNTVAGTVQDPTGLNIPTVYKSDSMGRTIETMGPEFNSNGAMVQTINWTVYLDDQHEVRTGVGFKFGVSSYSLVNPISITCMDPSGRVTDQIQATTSSTNSVPTGAVPRTDWTRWTHHTYSDQGRLAYTDVYHLIPLDGLGVEVTNYNRTSYDYDAMGRQDYVKSPGGTITRTVYDPRGLVLSVWVGTKDAGATPSNPGGSGGSTNNMMPVTINTYDEGAYGSTNDSLDGLLTKTASPVDTDSANNRIVEYRYDWRDRQVKTITMDGTNTFEAENVYDNLGRVTTAKETRANDSKLIAENVTHYDDWGRVYRTEQKGVNDSGSITQTLTSNTWYDAGNNVLKSAPAGSEAFTKATYDAIGRQTASFVGYYSGSGGDNPDSVTHDVILQETHTAYDQASHVLHTTTKERWHNATGNGSLLGPAGSQPKSRDSYVAILYDGIGRRVATANYGTNAEAGPPSWPTTVPTSSPTQLVTLTGYNVEGELAFQVDPAGMTMYTVYDAAGRVTSTTRNYFSAPTEVVEMAYNPDGQIATLTAVNSDTTNQVTTYNYGVALGGSGLASNLLLASINYPDGGDVDYEYNRQGQRIKLTDQLGTIHEYDYDKLGRQMADIVSTDNSGAVNGVRRIAWSYDDRKHLKNVTSYDAASSGNVTSDVQFAYNDFNQVVTEYQQHGSAVDTDTSPKVKYTYANGSANTIRREKCIYPNTKELVYDYSAGANSKLSRVSGLTWDLTQVATYDYLGLGQVVIQKYPEPATDVEYTLATGSGSNPYAGMDQFGRIIDLLWKQSSTELVHLEYGYDLASNRTFRRDNVAHSYGEKFDEVYDYDGLQRLLSVARGELNSTNTAFVGIPVSTQLWTLDTTGNWKQFVETPSPYLIQSRTHNTANEITAITESFGAVWPDPAYDANGNTTEMPSPLSLTTALEGIYDAWNRLVATDDGTTTVTYAYDGLQRRITRASGGTSRHFYYNDQWQCLEEQVSGLTVKQYVWGLRYIDDLVLSDDTSDRYYYCQDANFNVVAALDDDGAVVERYAYTPYGEVVFLDDVFANPSSSSSIGNEFLYTGRRLDPETGLQLNRNRYYHAQLGRFVTRDPIGYRGGMNLFRYSGDRPLDQVDPSGTSAFLAGCGIGAIYSGGTSLVIDIIQNGLTWQGCCNAGCSAVATCVQTGLIAQFPSPITACAAAFLAKILRQTCKAAICGTDEPWNACDAISLLASCAVGLSAGALPKPKPPLKIHPDLEPLLRLLGINVAAWTAACRAGGPIPQPPVAAVSACCTFRSGGTMWSETVDCPSGDFKACCRDGADGYLWDWKVLSARGGGCSSR